MSGALENRAESAAREQAQSDAPFFHRQDWALFRTIAGLCQRAGCPSDDLPSIVVKELVDNALDAGASCEIDLVDGVLIVADRGPGIPGDDGQVATLFSVRRALTSSKLLRLPSRGALGNGLRVVAGAVLATGGDLIVATRGRRLRIRTNTQTGESEAERLGTSEVLGTRIEVRLGAPLEPTSEHLYLAQMAIHAAEFSANVYKGRTSPHWYDVETFHEVLMACLPSTSVRELCARLDGCTGGKAGEIAAPFLGRPAADLTRDEARDLLMSARRLAKEVRPERLGDTKKDAFPGEYAVARDLISFSDLSDGFSTRIPVVVEAWASPDDDEGDATFLVNRTPCVTHCFARHYPKQKLVQFSGDGLRLHVKSRMGVRYHVNILTPYMPITSDGKAPALGRFDTLIEQAVAKATRRIQGRAYRDVADLPARTTKEVVFEHMEEAIRVVSGDRAHRFSWRQVYYRVRPAVFAAFKKELDWNYFAQSIVTDWEADRGEDPLAYRDPRGTMYHPHEGREIPVGTLAVEAYCRPTQLFNKVLYIEKEGFFHALRAAHWPERHDCALITSKGQPTRAARDLLDLIGRGDEPVQVFCVHDGDAAGTLIYQTLQEETRARPRRHVEVINLGLDPWEAMALAGRGEVEVEACRYDKEQPVAGYVPIEWRVWLQTHRVELNAFTTPQFLAWLDAKIGPYLGKVVPPPDVLADRLRGQVQQKVREEIREAILAESDFHNRFDRALYSIEPRLVAEIDGLDRAVRSTLAREPASPWTQTVDARAISFHAEGYS